MTSCQPAVNPGTLEGGVRGSPVHSPVSVPPRSPLIRRLRLQAGYNWRNSGDRLTSGLRVRWDTRGYVHFPAVRSESGGMSISYSGLPEGVRYTLDFTEQRRETGTGEAAVRQASQIRGWALNSPDALPDADIVIVGTSAIKAWRTSIPARLIIPMRVHFVLDFDADIDVLIRRCSKGVYRDFRQQSRKHQWEFGIEDDPAWFDYFYENIYMATMTERYGSRARTERGDSAYECLFRPGILFYLSMDGTRVGGHLCHWNPASGVLTSRLLGVLNGAEEYYAAGVLKSMYFHLIHLAARNGVSNWISKAQNPCSERARTR